MKISSEFSKYATHYGSYNSIQNQVAKKLLALVDSKPKKILDLGCGEGALCKNISWEYEYFIGIDFAQKMLDLHPKSNKIEVFYGDFNDTELFVKLASKKFDLIFSASALQWAYELESIFKNVKLLGTPIAFALFTSNTFKTLHETASVTSILRSSEEIERLARKYFDVSVEVVDYRLSFESVREMFRYIKKSGVSGSRKVLSYKQTKKLMQEYPLNYLEFEVIFLKSR